MVGRIAVVLVGVALLSTPVHAQEAGELEVPPPPEAPATLEPISVPPAYMERASPPGEDVERPERAATTDSLLDVYGLSWAGFGIGSVVGAGLGLLLGGVAGCEGPDCDDGLSIGSAVGASLLGSLGAAIAVGLSDRGGNSILAILMAPFSAGVSMIAGLMATSGSANWIAGSWLGAGLTSLLSTGIATGLYELFVALRDVRRSGGDVQVSPTVGVTETAAELGVAGVF